jgi:hypothetical protein
LFIVRARNTIGWSLFSVTPFVKDIVRTAPQAPLTKILEGPLTDDSQIQITWAPVVDPITGLDTVTSYAVYWDNGNNG